MPKSPQISARVSAIAKELANGKERAELLRKYAKKWQIAERSVDRYIENAKSEAKTLRNLAEKVANDTLVAETQEAVKSGLKSKLDRLMFYQNEINRMDAQLRGEVEFTFAKGNSISKSHSINKETGKKEFVLPIQVQNEIRKTIQSYQMEISKIEGDYAPTRIAPTDPKGNALTGFIVEVIQSKRESSS